MPQNLASPPPPPDDWVSDVYADPKEQVAMDIWRKVHNLKVLEQREAYREFFGKDFEEYPEWQTEENA